MAISYLVKGYTCHTSQIVRVAYKISGIEEGLDVVLRVHQIYVER